MKVLLVGSGKGGTGKTTMSSLIATHLTSQYNVGLLDTDLGCPSVAKMFGIGDYKFKFRRARFSHSRFYKTSGQRCN